jgi:molybdopterin molybdotransferase
MNGSTSLQSLGTLTALDVALAQLHAFVEPVKAQRRALAHAIGRVLAQDVISATPLPTHARALRDGYALNSQEIAGASSYSPVLLMSAPARVNLGDRLPDGSDCVLEGTSLDLSGPMPQAVSEAAPGDGVRRAGEDAPADSFLLRKGHKITPNDLLVLHEMGMEDVALSIPRITLINRGAARISMQMIEATLRAFGADCRETQALDFSGADLVITIGGTGEGEADRTISELRAACDLFCHGLACAPGRSMAIGRQGAVPIIALPGSPADALAGWLFIIKPLLSGMTGRAGEAGLRLPLSQKLASRVGVAEAALLARRGDHFVPLCLGDMPLRLMAEATHICLLSAASEGHAAGEIIEAFPFE